MTALLLAGGLALFAINSKYTKAALICLVPVTAVTAYLLRGPGIYMYAACTGIAVIAAAPVVERLAGALAASLQKTSEETDNSGEDIVDNKTKWRLIVAGYVIFILFAIFSVISIVRLNAKVNTLYGFTQDLDQRIEEVSDTKQ